MSTQCTGGSAALEKAEVHTESIQQVQPIDLAARGTGGQVVLRPVRAFTSAHVTAKSVGGPGAVGGLTAPIISVNRPANLTLLPTRVSAAQPAGTQVTHTQAISTYQIARVGNMRSATLTPGQQPASITVTPISASNFGANIRLASATVNNGSWIQATGSGTQGTFGTPIRTATITVGGRPVRPDGTKMIHIPQPGSLQHVTQLQMVDSKGSILKPSITTTPIVNLRGALQGGGTGGLPLAPFTIRNIVPAVQQRPQTSTSNSINQQKILTQPGHGAPIQFVNASNKNVIQAITPIPRLNAVNAVCLLSTNANLAPNSSSPVVAVASKQGPTGLIMSPSMNSGNSGLPLTKVIPVGRDGSTSIVDSLFAQSNNPSTSNAVTVSAVSVSGTQVSSGHNISSTNVILPSPGSGQGIVTNASGSTQSHQFLHVQGPINLHHANAGTATLGVGIPPSGLTSGNLAPSYFVEKNGNLSLLQTHQSRPISLEKSTSHGKNIPTGSMILTAQHPHLQSGNSGQTATVTIPIAHGGQQVSFAHPITMSHSGPHQVQGSAQIITTPISAHVHHISTTVLGTMSTPSISVSAPTSLAQLGHAASQSGPLHAIPTHVISSQPAISISSSSASNSSFTNSSISSTVANNTSVTVANTCAISCNPVSVSVNLTSSAATTTTTSSSTSTACTTVSTGSSLSTSAPAQSPNTKSTTHSPRPSILRKQREVSDNHIPARAQRNLTLQLNFAGNTTNTSCNPTTIPPSASASAAAVAASANKENAGAMERGPPPINNSCNNNNSSTGLSILRKEFQPPNEESSWQSCSSHSSGSTTISATSETAEYQMNQPSSNSNMEAPVPLNCESVPSSSTFSGNASSPISQNGVVRPVTSSSQGRTKNSSKLQNKDIERLKRDKEDHVSPRKKPRKQQLTSSDFLEAVSPEISFYQGRGKKFRRMENNIFDGYGNSKPGSDPPAEDPPAPPKIVCVIKKPRLSLLSSSQTQLGKTRLNHFEHYSEVKSKEERRPTIGELANQKSTMQKVSGWKIERMANQMDQVVDLEVSVVNSFNSLLTRLEGKVGPNCPDRDINRILELLKGNIQRCKVIREQMTESRMQALRILDHKPRIVDVIGKHITKKGGKKKDRL